MEHLFTLLCEDPHPSRAHTIPKRRRGSHLTRKKEHEARETHQPNPRPLGPSVSPSRLDFQRLTNEISRNFPFPFGHTPVLIHVARFHAKPPKTRIAPTHDRHNTCRRPPKLFSPIVTFDSARLTRPIQNPDRQACPWNEVKGGGVTSRMRSRLAAMPSVAALASALTPGLANFDVSTFRRFHEKPPQTRTAPTHARQMCWHNPRKPCVTICHLRFCRTCACVRLLSPRSRPFLQPTACSLFSPYVTFDLNAVFDGGENNPGDRLDHESNMLDDRAKHYDKGTRMTLSPVQ